MITPPYLKKGSIIAVVATARTANEQQIEQSKIILEKQGFHVVISSNVSHVHHRFAGEDEERIRCFQSLLDDETIDAIWLARGGYGTVRILDSIDWTKFLKYPKWLIGFSDFTAVHLKLQQLKVASIHACTFTQVQRFGVANENIITVLEILLNQKSNYTFAGSLENKPGTSEGNLVGGNLSLICNSMGTATQLKTDDCILMLEDCDEYLYHYDRMFSQLHRAGLLQNLKGLIIGKSTIKPEPEELYFGFSLEEIVLHYCESFTYPICFNAPMGHTDKNYAFALNTNHVLAVEKNEVTITPY